MKLSIIAPCKNEEGNVKKLYSKIKDCLKDIKYEIIFINDGSEDKTLEYLKELYEEDMVHVKILSFSRNFKKEAAMLAGLEHASGEYTCIIDSDLQQNPGYLLDMLNFLDKNKEYDEVAMVMQKRNSDSKLMALCKNIFYKLMDSITDVHFEKSASDFRMFRVNVKETIISLQESNRFSKGIFAWVGYKVKYMPYIVEPRTSGKSEFGFIASTKYALDGIFAFSTQPLKIAYTCSILTYISFLIYLVVMFIFSLYNGTSAIILVMLFMFATLFLLVGILGSYLARIYCETQNRPKYVIKEKFGFTDKNIL